MLSEETQIVLGGVCVCVCTHTYTCTHEVRGERENTEV